MHMHIPCMCTCTQYAHAHAHAHAHTVHMHTCTCSTCTGAATARCPLICPLLTTYYLLLTTYHLLLTTYYSLLTKARFDREMVAQMPGFASLTMFRCNRGWLNEVCPPSYCRCTHCVLYYCLVRATDYALRSAYCALLTTSCSLLTTCCLLLRGLPAGSTPAGRTA